MNKVAIDLFDENESSDTNGTYLFRPTNGMTPSSLSASEENFDYLTQESPVAAELRVLSQPPTIDPISYYRNYVYPVAGRTTYIYHVELGINQEHDDFHGRQIEWLYTESSIATGADTMTEAAVGGGHSTCTASKAVGNIYGASKSATLVVVKMPNLDEASVSEVLDTVIDDINDKDRKRTSVVSISWGSKAIVNNRGTPTQPTPWTTLAGTLRWQTMMLRLMYVPLVCAAGNAAQQRDVHGLSRLYVDTIPAAYHHSFPYVVVGNSDNNGVKHPTSQIMSHPGLQVYAPGVGIKCASSTSSTRYRTWSGTSFCRSPL